MSLTEAALRRGAFDELGHHAVFLPNLNVMTVNKLLARLDGCGVIRTIQIHRFEEVAVQTDNAGSIIGHGMHPAMRREHAALSVTDNLPDTER